MANAAAPLRRMMDPKVFDQGMQSQKQHSGKTAIFLLMAHLILERRGNTMKANFISRRESLKLLGASGAIAAMGAGTACTSGPKQASKPGQDAEQAGEPASVIADRERRMKWWHAAKFGMFIH